MCSKLFWKTKKLDELNTEEWEALCDGCAICCLHKIEDEGSGQVYYTNVACRLLDLNTSLCKDYDHRSIKVKGCLPLTPELVQKINWLPESCAYRRISEGRGLADWHPLLSGDRNAVLLKGCFLRGKLLPEESVDTSTLEDRVVDWFD